MADGRRVRPRRGGVDRISDLPDELLHTILLRLPSTVDAVRTGVLSRRWRRVWAHVPGLSFHLDRGGLRRRSSMLHGIGAVLAAYAAPTLDRLTISIDRHQSSDPDLVGPWLRFASPRLVGELSIRCGDPWTVVDSWSEIELPACERATAIDLQLCVRLRFPATAGTFAALRVMRIDCLHLHKGDLERALSRQCPRLQELTLSTSIGVSHAVSIRSDSLERLKLCGQVANGHITVDAPRLVRLEMSRGPIRWRRNSPMMNCGAHIAAPELSEVIWHTAYDSRLDRIVETRRHLRRLEVVPDCDDRRKALVPKKTSALLERFDYVDELELHVRIPFAMDGWRNTIYEDFTMNLPDLPRCNVLKLHIQAEALGSKQPFVTSMRNLLQKCVGIKRLNVCLMTNSGSDWPWEPEEFPCGQLTTNDAIALDSLEEIEINSIKVKDGEAVLVRLLLLLSCRAVPRRVVVHATHRTNPYLRRRTCERIAGCCHPETTVEFYRYFDRRYGLMWARRGRVSGKRGNGLSCPQFALLGL